MGASILVVEDENIVGLNLQNRLKSLGYEVTAVVSSGEEALKRANETRPDLVLMDIMLKGELDGISAAEVLRKQDIPVVYLTAYADDSTLERAKVTEPAGYILKPFEIKDLRSTIEIALYRHRMEQKLKASEERYTLAVRGANDGIWDWDLTTNVVHYSPRWKEMMGFTEADIGTSPGDWLSRLHPDDKNALEWDISRHLDGITPHLENEYRIMHSDGRYRWMFCRGLAVRDEKGRPYRMAGSQSDVTRRRAMEEKLLQFAYYDPLTDLPNQVLFLDRLLDTYKKVRNHDMNGFSTAIIGIKNFDSIYADFGIIMANGVLVETARRLSALRTDQSLVCRLSGGDFSIVFESDAGSNAALLQRMLKEISQPVKYGSRTVVLKCMAGIAHYDSGYESADQIVRDAAFAMLHAPDDTASVYSSSARDS